MSYYETPVHRPSSLDEALAILSSLREKAQLVAGGTDVMIALRAGQLKGKELVDLSALRGELGYIKCGNGKIKIGALATYSDILSSCVSQKAPLLAAAIRKIGSPQIRNLATLAGNIATASPAGDSIPPLYVLGSRIVLVSISGARKVDAESFFLGPRKTVRRPDEMILEVEIEEQPAGSKQFHEKLGLRAANAISVASAAGLLELEGDIVRSARIALGAVAPTVVRAKKAESVLEGRKLTDDLAWAAAIAAAEGSKPITDVRGSAAYRRLAVAALVYRGLSRIMRRS